MPVASLAQEPHPQDDPAADEYEAFLLTYGPGEVYWQRFGHNAIWLREPARGLDHSFNFGYFDFDQENFLLRFVQGRMLYFSLAQPAAREMEFYQRDNRTIRMQRLDLDPASYARLRDHLLEQVRPENRDYLYDYYLDNCSTRLRDALDVALDGALSRQFLGAPARQNFRQHTRRLTADDFWYYLGLEAALGRPIERNIDRWQEMFIPGVLAAALTDVEVSRAGGTKPLVVEDRPLFTSTAASPPATPRAVWYRYFLLTLVVVALGIAAARAAPPVLVEGFMQAWMLIAGTLGLLLVVLWLWSDHHAANPNANLLLLNPLMVLALVPALRKPVAVVTALGLAGAVVVMVLPGVQYTADVVALLLPLNLASAYRLWRFDAPQRRSVLDTGDG